ncbi:hypothetical protein BHM03_00000753, partial [Ensete ventricosum]
ISVGSPKLPVSSVLRSRPCPVPLTSVFFLPSLVLRIPSAGDRSPSVSRSLIAETFALNSLSFR